MSPIVIGIGLMAQICFSARILIQWFLSEKRKEVVSPTLFWVFSLIGSYLMFYYGWLRNDFSIIFGQFISFYIYIYNLKLKNVWVRVPLLLRIALLITPLALALVFTFNDGINFMDAFLCNKAIPLWLVMIGTIGQSVFTFRFVYQWIYSSKNKISALPPTFWWISLSGSLIIIIYALFRVDPILILGQSFGFVSYIRNLMIGYNSKKEKI